MFKLTPIHNFKNIYDYLPIFNGVLITDMLVIILTLFGFIKSNVLLKWYRTYNLSAVIADVFIIVIGIIIARYLYFYIFDEYSLVKFIFLVLCIQITHDILFYIFVSSVPRGMSKILDLFKDYGKENSYKAIIADSMMMITAVLLASWFNSLSFNSNIIILIVCVYLVPYLIYSL
jgi:hypothetical protein